jgi:hypothetical protein
MRWNTLPLIILAVAAATPAVACDAKTEIEAAFEKQRKATAWRSEISTKVEDGQQKQVFEYLPPDRMRRVVTVPKERRPVETIGIGRWAWTNAGAGWEELKPHFAQMVMNHLQQTFDKVPKVTTKFNCLGKTTYEGKSYTTYRTDPEKAPDGAELVRSIYIDPNTRLPAANVIGPAGGKGEPVHKETYDYPTDVVIEKPF